MNLNMETIPSNFFVHTHTHTENLLLCISETVVCNVNVEESGRKGFNLRRISTFTTWKNLQLGPQLIGNIACK